MTPQAFTKNEAVNTRECLRLLLAIAGDRQGRLEEVGLETMLAGYGGSILMDQMALTSSSGGSLKTPKGRKLSR